MKKLLILTFLLTALYNSHTVYAANYEEGIAGISLSLENITYTEMEYMNIKSTFNITYNWTTVRLNLRTEPSMDSNVLVTLDKRCKVKIIITLGEWTKVEYGEKIGYVASRYLTDEEFNQSSFTDNEINIIQRITEAECTGQSVESKTNVVSVIVNRIVSSKFPDTVKKVVFQDDQFSPTEDGRYNEVKITKETIEAVDKVLEDGVINEALYFCSMKDIKNLSNKKWFKELTYLFKDDSGHSFFK